MTEETCTEVPQSAAGAGPAPADGVADASGPPSRGGPTDPRAAVHRHLLAARTAAELRRALGRRVGRRPGDRAGSTLGQRAADGVTGALGTWTFLVLQSVVLAAWLLFNTLGGTAHWDPYPFILLNLVLSFQAAYTAPVLLMSANRQAAQDRERAEHDLLVNERAEAEVEELLNLARAQLAQNREVLQRIVALETAAGARGPV